jgi:hypothetical protein
MKIKILFAMIFFLMIFSNTLFASTSVVYSDVTSVISGNAKAGSDFEGSATGYLGDSFNTTDVQVTITDSTMKFDIRTRNDGKQTIPFADGTSYHNDIADFALDFDNNGIYEYGVDLTMDLTDDSLTSSGFYKVNTWTSSEDLLDGETKGDYYYGKYLDNGQNSNPTMVDIKDGVLIKNALQIQSVKRTPSIYKDEGVDLWIYSFAIDLAGLDLDPNDDDGYSFLFATAHCANDVITGGTHVPIPATVFLMGLGLAGITSARRKQIFKA